MSDSVQFLVDESVTESDAPELAANVVRKLVADGWIEAVASEAPMLGGLGHRPGANARASYMPAENEVDFSALMTNGVAIRAERFTNLAFPSAPEPLACPGCSALVDLDELMPSVARFMSGDGDPTLACAKCGYEHALRGLRGPSDQSPVVCGNLVVEIYNWPAIDAPGWKRRLDDVIAEVIGTRPSLAWARI